jgi:pSer/pThr/pTyr-binding forkhead associated (FHA) protein
MKHDSRGSAKKPDNAEQKSAEKNTLFDDANVFTELISDDDLAEIDESHLTTNPAFNDHNDRPFKLSTPLTSDPPSQTLLESIARAAPATLSEPDWTSEKTLLIDDEDTMTASLIQVDTGKRFLLDTFPFEIGRSSRCQLQIADRSLSRQHAKILKSESGLSIQDMGSANGIQVNDISVKQVILMDEDTITLGHVNLRFELSSSDPLQRKSWSALQDQMAKVNVTHPNWKNMTVAGLIGFLLLGGFLYKLRIDSRAMIIEQSLAPIAPKFNSNNSVNQSPESFNLREKKALPNKVAKSSGAINNPNENKTVSDNLSANTLVQHEAILKTTSDNTLAPEASTIQTTEPGSSSANKKQRIVTAQSLIYDARQLYQKGQVSKALKLLGDLSISSRVSVESQNQAARLETELHTLYSNYQRGKQAYSKDKKAQAWAIWKTFIEAEKNLQLPGKSKYALLIRQRVLEESLARGTALQKTDSKAAYRHLQRAALLDPERQVLTTTAALKSEIRDTYHEAERLEHSNLTKAMEHWRQVTELAPTSHEYYIKAKAKLRFYEEMSQ